MLICARRERVRREGEVHEQHLEAGMSADWVKLRVAFQVLEVPKTGRHGLLQPRHREGGVRVALPA